MKNSLYDLHKKIENNHWWFTARRKIVCSLLTYLSPPEERLSVINVGCGTGGDLLYLSKYYRCIGIDSSRAAVVAARERAPKAKVILGSDAKAVPSKRKYEKRAWLFLDVLEHIENELNFFSNYAEMIEPGEITIITVPANPKLWSSHDVAFGHYRRYTEETLKLIWEKLPFKVLLFSHFNTRLYPLIWLSRKLKIKFGKAKLEKDTDFCILPPSLNTILHKIFYSEHKRILGIINGGSSYSCGASLIVVLKKV